MVRGLTTVIDEYKQIHKPNAPKGTKVLLDVGDMLVYSGCEFEHWREPFEGQVCGQVFLHYNHVNGPFADKNLFDKRRLLVFHQYGICNTMRLYATKNRFSARYK